ncbi:hypothetical protein D840_01987 [Enterococcus faecalis 20.SD.W.06]|nr:hypothetical protein D840_01987 [Enterococcus faecalis 20.SD.W.06]
MALVKDTTATLRPIQRLVRTTSTRLTTFNENFTLVLSRQVPYNKSV